MNKIVVAVIIAVIAVLILVISLVTSSLEKLSSKEVGLQYDTIQKDLDSEVFTEGLHLGPVGFEFIKFPNIYTTMEFNDLECLNHDGIKIQLDVTYQYRVMMPYLKQVIMEFKDLDGYQGILRTVGIASLHEACSYFNTTRFQNNRGDFNKRLERTLKARYKALKCDVEDLQVNNINRPSEYEQAIRSKERAKEDVRVAEVERPRLETEANTTLREAVAEAKIIIDRAESEARILNNMADVEASAILEQYSKEAEAYETIMGKSGLNFSPEGFISYLGTRVISEAKNPVYIGLQSPAKSSHLNN